ncbi:hypothetical protein BP6252_11027 [Coleophoma cylindrospora]|uniref:Lysophospholipase n=1 Tax=Coleophoma cylindrospora TaxID=1849047 RepID=A0A3D8QNV8_9HELO|nr:hypothetical protein BP6252_11027 [Coleophoma cylindrospora]
MRVTLSWALVAASLIRSVPASYAPVVTSCPTTPLVRAASGLASNEETYRLARKTKADASLAAWLSKTNSDFNVSGDLPTIALSNSGGSYRALLIGAGVVSALDGNDDTGSSTSGLYQAMSYHTALSGGAWLLSSIIANDWTTITDLRTTWEPAFANGLLAPGGGVQTIIIYAVFLANLVSKAALGFTISIVDLWARALSYQLLPGADYGADNTLSGITSKSKFIAHEVPFPIMTGSNVEFSGTSCLPPPVTAPVWEFTPYEFGSWDSSVAAFSPTEFLGSKVVDGVGETCYKEYDNLGFVLGTSSALFNNLGFIPDDGIDPPLLEDYCFLTNGTATSSALYEALNFFLELFYTIDSKTVDILFAQWPNPFYQSPESSLVSSQDTLHMVDGGQAGQTSPIFPLLVPERNVSVILVNDNNGDTAANYPNGTALYNTYLSAQVAGLTRMPFIPEPAVLLAENRTEVAVFFGCGNSTTATIVWLPNAPLTPAGGAAPTDQLQYNTTETGTMIANGVAVMTQSDDSEWATCLGCAIMEGSSDSLPAACTACLAKYCYF